MRPKEPVVVATDRRGPAVVAAQHRLSSPCVGICQVDERTGWCGGCARTAQEMSDWHSLPWDAQTAIWSDLPRRGRLLGLRYRLLPLTGPPLVRHLANVIAAAGAVLSIEVPGAHLPGDGGATVVEARDDDLTLQTPTARASIHLAPGTRAFELTDHAGSVDRTVLALHRARFKVAPNTGLTPLGPDWGALADCRRTARLFDLGLGRRALQICVRTDDPQSIRRLEACAGRAVLELKTIAEILAHPASDGVVLSPFGRLEVEGVIRFDLDLVRSGRELPPGLDLPPDYVACVHVLQAHHAGSHLG